MQPTNKSCVRGVAFDYLHKALPKLKASLRMVAVGIGMLGVFSSAWGACTDVIITGPVGQQTNSTTLCTFSISTTGTILISSPAGINNTRVGSSVGTITTLTNSGTISGAGTGVYNSGIIGTLINTNSGEILSQSGSLAWGIANHGTINTLTNSGIISSTRGDGIYNVSTITTLTNTNSGTISGAMSGNSGIYNDFGGTITTLTNSGTISSTLGFGVDNLGTITTLNNAQGSTGAALTYAGILPTNYNVIVNSAGSYGQLRVRALSFTGTTNFGVSSLSSPSSAILNVRLPGVLQGFTAPLTNYVNGLVVVGSTYTFTSASYSYYLVQGATLGT